jgi:hypothetical protein
MNISLYRSARLAVLVKDAFHISPSLKSRSGSFAGSIKILESLLLISDMITLKVNSKSRVNK